MDPVAMILLAIRGLSVVANNPLLGGGSSLQTKEISDFLAMLGELIERGDEAHDELKTFAEMVDSMAKEGRSPTRAEWDVLRGRSDAAHAVIQDAAAELEPEFESDPIPDDITDADPADDGDPEPDADADQE